MKPRVYVAGKFEDASRVRIVQADLKDMGFEISFDWTHDPEAGPTQAMNDYNGVMNADVVVCVFEKDYDYCGSLVEMGIALGAGKPVFVLGNAPVTRRNIFMNHPNVFRGLSGLVGVR